MLFQNILPFLHKDIKNFLLKFFYSITCKSSDGAIFLSKYCKKLISKKIKVPANNSIIYHGVDKIYLKKPKFKKISKKKKINLIYVSSISFDKNQINLLDAMSILSKKKYLFNLFLIGPLDKKINNKFYSKIKEIDNSNQIIHIHNASKKIINYYLNKSDISVYPSRNETFGISLLESMANSKIICCSKRSTMPEILKNGGIYFNPESPLSIATSIEKIIKNNQLGHSLAQKSYNIAKKFSWKKSSNETFKFLYAIKKNKNFNY